MMFSSISVWFFLTMHSTPNLSAFSEVAHLAFGFALICPIMLPGSSTNRDVDFFNFRAIISYKTTDYEKCFKADLPWISLLHIGRPHLYYLASTISFSVDNRDLQCASSASNRFWGHTDYQFHVERQLSSGHITRSIAILNCSYLMNTISCYYFVEYSYCLNIELLKCPVSFLRSRNNVSTLYILDGPGWKLHFWSSPTQHTPSHTALHSMCQY